MLAIISTIVIMIHLKGKILFTNTFFTRGTARQEHTERNVSHTRAPGDDE
jgi:hypothetical protein